MTDRRGRTVPDSNWPPAQRTAGRTALGAAYLFAAAAGSAVLFAPAHVVEERLGTVLGYGLAALAFGSGVVAALAVLLHRWPWEWVACSFVAGAFAGYALLEFDPADPAISAALGALSAMFAWRWLSLWVFSLQLNRMRRTRATDRRSGSAR